jgi:hypothetical protein
MKIEGEYTFNESRDRVWKVLQNPEVLSQALPGCEALEQIGDNEYKATLNVRIGPVQGKFNGTVRLSNLNPPLSYHMMVEGQGPPGFVKGEGDVTLEEQNGSTIMRYTGDAQVGGRIASVGQRLLDSSARSLTRQGLQSIDKLIQAGDATPEPIAPSQTQIAAEVAKDVASDAVKGISSRLKRLVGNDDEGNS